MTKNCEFCDEVFYNAKSRSRFCSIRCARLSCGRLSAGRRFGFLTVVEFSHVKIHAVYKCLCDCGNETLVAKQSLVQGLSRSCGCFRKESVTKNKTTHGMRKSPEYSSFHAAKRRCNNPRNKDFAFYGGRGIQFKFESFEDFYSEVGEKPSPRHSIDRINVNGHYEKGNVRWATSAQQASNRRTRRPRA